MLSFIVGHWLTTYLVGYVIGYLLLRRLIIVAVGEDHSLKKNVLARVVLGLLSWVSVAIALVMLLLLWVEREVERETKWPDWL